MGFTAKLPILIVLFSLFVSSAFSLRLPADDLVNPYDDPRTEIRHCRQRCQQQQGRGFHHVRECMEQCESMSPDVDDEAVIVLVDQDFRQCQRRCRRQQSGRRCYERCEDRFGCRGDRQQGSRCEDERDVPFLRRDPEQQRHQQCRMRCQSQEPGHQQRRCRDRCEEQQTERGCRRHSDDEVNADDRHDPEQRYRQCKMRCQRQESGHQQRQCLKECQEQHRQEMEIRSSDSDDEHVDRRDPEQAFRQCRRQCSGGRCERRCEEQRQCHQRCRSKFPYRGQEGKLGHCVESCYGDEEEEGRGFMETICRQKCRIQGGGYECQRRCQRQYGGGAALASLLSIFA